MLEPAHARFDLAAPAVERQRLELARPVVEHFLRVHGELPLRQVADDQRAQLVGPQPAEQPVRGLVAPADAFLQGAEQLPRHRVLQVVGQEPPLHPVEPIAVGGGRQHVGHFRRAPPTAARRRGRPRRGAARRGAAIRQPRRTPAIVAQDGVGTDPQRVRQVAQQRLTLQLRTYVGKIREQLPEYLFLRVRPPQIERRRSQLEKILEDEYRGCKSGLQPAAGPLLDIIGGVLAALKRHHGGPQLHLFQHGGGAPGGVHPGGVRVHHQAHVVRVARQQPGVLTTQRRAERSHRRVTGRIERDHVEVSLGHVHGPRPLDAIARLGQPVEHPALAVMGGLRRVEILGAVAHGAPAERHHLAARGRDREHDAVAEQRQHAAVRAGEQAGAHQKVVAVAVRAQEPMQPVTGARRVADAVAGDRLSPEPPSGQMPARRRRGAGVEQDVMEAVGEPAVELHVGLPLGPFRAAHVLHLHAGALGQQRERLREGELLHLHHEVDHRAALLAAEAVEQIPVRGERERRGLFGMKGTQPDQPVAAALQAHVVAGHHVDSQPVVEFRDLVGRDHALTAAAAPAPVSRPRPSGRRTWRRCALRAGGRSGGRRSPGP